MKKGEIRNHLKMWVVRGMNTKEKIVQAAIELFNTQGYNGTSIRMIADKANVNVALVSYYFGGKQGLLETLFVDFYEGYIAALEKVVDESNHESAISCLGKMIHAGFEYQQQNIQLSRFVQRETTLDTMLVREIMTTYLRKEKHLFYQIIKKGVEKKEIKKQPIDFVIILIRSMLTMPYLHPQYIREIHHLFIHEPYFTNQYIEYMKSWLENYLCYKHLPFSRSGKG